MLFPTLVVIWSQLVPSGAASGQQCQSFSTDNLYCKNVNYNQTFFPHRILESERIRTQAEAERELNKPGSLITFLRDSNCHKSIQYFICLYYFPICSENFQYPIYPCRDLCDNIKNTCLQSLKGTISADQWPFDCNKLPKYIDPKTNQNAEICGFEGEKSNSIFESEEPKNSICTNELDCPGLLKTGMRTNHFFFDLPDCAPPCKGHFWSDDEIQLSRKWILAWSTFCLISTLFTVSTYLIDRDRFRYPERPIVFLAACYMIISCVHITGYFMEDEVACYDNIAQQDTTWSFYSTNPTSIIEQGTKKQSCTVLFMILYFTTMSSSIWWLVLCVNWFLSAVLKWSGEAIEAQSQYFHIVSWSVPAVATISVLALGKIEGDPLSGICFVGQYDTQSLQIFLLWPQLVLICIGFVFLVIGFLSMYRIRMVVKNEGTGKHEGLEKLMLKIGVFSSLYLIPASILLGCYFYIYIYNDRWNKTWMLSERGREYGFNPTCEIEQEIAEKGERLPNFTFFMLRYFMSLIVGVTCGFWIWSDKTLNSWCKFVRSITCRDKAPASQVQERRELTRGNPLLSVSSRSEQVRYQPGYAQSNRPL